MCTLVPTRVRMAGVLALGPRYGVWLCGGGEIVVPTARQMRGNAIRCEGVPHKRVE